MRTALFIFRKLRTGTDGKRSTPAVKVATAAVALSVAVMIAAISIVGGFKREITNRIVGFNSHLTMYVAAGDEEGNTLTLTPTLRTILDSIPYVTSYELQAAIPAVIKTPTDFKGVYFKGAQDADHLKFIGENLEEGHLPSYANNSKSGENSLEVLVSRKAASQLNLKAGDEIDTYFISDKFQTRRLKIAAIYNTRFSDFDDVFIYGDIGLVQELVGLQPNQGSSMRIETDDLDNVEYYAADLRNILFTGLVTGRVSRQYNIETVHARGAHYFQWLSLLDTNVAVILVLMTIVACITLVSGMLIIILDKIRFIGLMKALGAGNKLLRQVFILLAIRIAAIGLVIGNALIIILLYVQDKTRFIPLDPDSYYIDFVPVELNPIAIIGLNIAVLVVIAIVLLVPSAFVAKIAPAKTLHGE